MKTVIAGLGSIGRRHLRNLVSLGEKDIILLRSKLATLPDDELAGFQVVTRIEDALDLHPDAVVVSNPSALHLDIAIPAAERGIHLLLEKPVSHSFDRVDDLKRAARRTGTRILVGFQFRFHPTLQIIKELITKGELGEVVTFRVNWGEYLPNWHPWEDYRKSYAARSDLGGGVTLTLCHPFDYLRWLFTDEVEKLWAFTQNAPDIGLNVDSVADVGLKFTKGATGSVHLDYLQRPGSHTIEITCTKGRILWENATAQLQCYLVETDNWNQYDPPAGFERNWLFIEEMKSFLKMVRFGETSPCTLDDGIRALAITQAVGISASTGKLIEF